MRVETTPAPMPQAAWSNAKEGKKEGAEVVEGAIAGESRWCEKLGVGEFTAMRWTTRDEWRRAKERVRLEDAFRESTRVSQKLAVEGRGRTLVEEYDWCYTNVTIQRLCAVFLSCSVTHRAPSRLRRSLRSFSRPSRASGPCGHCPRALR